MSNISLNHCIIEEWTLNLPLIDEITVIRLLVASIEPCFTITLQAPSI